MGGVSEEEEEGRRGACAAWRGRAGRCCQVGPTS
jgi:hypothetical protein